MNITWLRQALELLARLDDKTYTTSPPELIPHRAGSHLRHIVEFYECFLSGLPGAHIDYDARKRDPFVEQSRAAAAVKINTIIDRLGSEEILRTDSFLWVRMEDSAAIGMEDGFLISSTGRELQVLSSHTIHHFALISATLRSLGFHVDSDFGMAPSTLRYLRAAKVA
jgi:hypothetical protein